MQIYHAAARRRKKYYTKQFSTIGKSGSRSGMVGRNQLLGLAGVMSSCSLTKLLPQNTQPIFAVKFDSLRK